MPRWTRMSSSMNTVSFWLGTLPYGTVLVRVCVLFVCIGSVTRSTRTSTRSRYLSLYYEYPYVEREPSIAPYSYQKSYLIRVLKGTAGSY
eukprot:scaffold383850_cov17-Prasinocladus_malaysianus.AAC.1